MLILDELMHLVEDFRPVLPMWTEEEEEADSDPESMQVGLQRIKMLKSDNYYSSNNAVITGSALRSHGDENDFK